MNCEGCGLSGCKKVPPQLPPYPAHPSLLWVGQAPGGVESITKIPFSGPAGKMQWRLMRSAGFDKALENITNTALCAPPDDREPAEEEIECCSDHLREEIALVRPKLIIAIGKVALRALTGMGGPITRNRGQTFPLLSKWGWECPVLATLHSSFVMRQRQWIDLAGDDLKLVPGLIGDEVASTKVQVLQEHREYEFILDPDESTLASELEAMIPYDTSVDIETPGQLDMRKAEVVGISFCCDGYRSVAVDLLGDKSKMEVIKRFCEDKQANKRTQNGQFDVGVLETNGINVAGLRFDTLYAEHVMNSDLPGNLDVLRSRYAPQIEPYKPLKKEMKNFVSWEAGKRLEYNCWDTITTHWVAEAQLELLDPGQLKVLREIELPLIWVFNKMERKGVRVDIDALALQYAAVEPQLNSIVDIHFRPIGLNPASPVQLAKYFGLRDGTGEDELLKLIKRGHEHSALMQAVLDYRGLSKVASNYLLGTYKRLDAGYAHTHFKIEGTGTGRPASVNPNLNNVPKYMRDIFIPDDPDTMEFTEGDYSQLELHTIANVTHERTMLADLASGMKVHHIMGKVIYGREWAKLSDQERLREKAVVFGTTYGRTPRSIAMEFGIPTFRAQEWQDQVIGRYPDIMAYRRRQEAAFAIGRTVTPFGRSRVLVSLPQAYNTPVQSTAADIGLGALIEADKRGLDLRLTVYDSLTIEHLKRDRKAVKQELKEVMERPVKELNNYRFPAKIESGPTWAELTEQED